MKTHLKITVPLQPRSAGIGAAPAVAKQGRGPDGQQLHHLGNHRSAAAPGKKQKARAVNPNPTGTLTKAQNAS